MEKSWSIPETRWPTGKAASGFVKAYDAAHRIEFEGRAPPRWVIGPENWPMPIPVVKQGDRWHFDTVASAQKIIDRRVGRNELNVIEVCRAYVAAQREYASEHTLASGLHEYARKFDSSRASRTVFTGRLKRARRKAPLDRWWRRRARRATGARTTNSTRRRITATSTGF